MLEIFGGLMLSIIIAIITIVGSVILAKRYNRLTDKEIAIGLLISGFLSFVYFIYTIFL